jgi:DNA-binding GntR family transcriptional regulator
MKTDAVFKLAFNNALDLVSEMADGAPLPPETALSATLGISRTTVRKISTTLTDQGVVAGAGRERTIRAPSKSMRRFPEAETVSTSAQVEKRFMEWMLRGNIKPGDYINGLELARRFNVSPSGIREYLNRFSRFQLIEKRPNSGWVFRGFTTDFAMELMQVRELFELSSARAFAGMPRHLDIWQMLDGIEREHHDLLKNMDSSSISMT